MVNLSQKVVVKELLEFYRRYEGDAGYRARLIECWRDESKNDKNMWCGAYKEVLKQCR